MRARCLWPPDSSEIGVPHSPRLANFQGLANTFANLGSVHLMRGELLDAEEKYQQALGISEDLGHFCDKISGTDAVHLDIGGQLQGKEAGDIG